MLKMLKMIALIFLLSGVSVGCIGVRIQSNVEGTQPNVEYPGSKIPEWKEWKCRVVDVIEGTIEFLKCTYPNQEHIRKEDRWYMEMYRVKGETEPFTIGWGLAFDDGECCLAIRPDNSTEWVCCGHKIDKYPDGTHEYVFELLKKAPSRSYPSTILGKKTIKLFKGT